MNYLKLLAFLVLASFAMPMTAARADDAAAGGGLLTTTIGITATIALAGVGSYASSSKGNDDHRRGAAAMLYLRQHAAQVREELTMGRGPMLASLATELRIRAQDVGDFTRRVRCSRQALLALAEPATLTPQRALQFFAQIEQFAGKVRG